MAWIYADYLQVREDLVAVYTEEVDKTSPSLWQAFIPHQDMYKLLSRLLDSLERKGKDQIRSLWLHGAYGTGKTFAAFVVKHLLEDPLEAVEAYLTKHDLTRNLWPRFRALRQRGPYLVVWRSSSGHLDSQLKLFAELQQAVGEQLQRQGFDHAFPGAFKEAVLQKLSGPNPTYNWPAIFEKYRWEFFPDFAQPQAVLVAARTEDKPEVLVRISTVLEKEGIVLNISPDVMKARLKEIIDQNRLQGILCLWDEFTDFFRQNQALGGLQELAHAAVEFPFYLLLITHRSPELVYGDQEGMRKILERFHNIHFHLQPVTTYTLAGNAMEVRPERREEWEAKQLTLWDQVKGIAGHLFDHEGTLQEFQKLVPLQPYAAFLLSTLASKFSSSQRTLFRFLKDSQPGGFIWFLRHHPQELSWYWLTPDIIWDYFFGEEAEETELTEKVRDVVNFCRSRLPLIQGQLPQRLFKGIMLFLVLSRELTGVEERLRPCRRNLALAFQGTPLAEKLPELEKALRHQHCLNILPMGQDEVEYTLPLITKDQQLFERILEEIKRQTSFEQMAKETEALGRALKENLEITGLAALRAVVVTISGEELRRRREHVAPDLKPYQIGVVVVAVQTEQELGEAEKAAAQVAAQTERVAYLVIQTPFSERRWEQWLEQLAHERYCREVGDEANRQFYQQRGKAVIKEWTEQIRVSSHCLYWRRERLLCQVPAGLQRRVENYIRAVYPAGPEQVSTLSTILSGPYGLSAIKIGLGITPSLTHPFKALIQTLAQFSRGQEQPALRQLQAKVREFFHEQPERYLADLWKELQQPPFGLFPSPIAAVLLGFFLKEICSDHYYCDGVSCRELNPEKLAELIEQVMKEKRGYQDLSIRKCSPLADRFCRHLKEVFGLAATEGNYPEELKQVLRQKLQNWGYPLWALPYVPEAGGFALMKPFLQQLQAFLRETTEAARGIMLNEEELRSKAEQALEKYRAGSLQKLSFAEILAVINLIAEENPALVPNLRRLLKPDNLAAGMQVFIQQSYPALAQELAAQGLPISWVGQRLREHMQEEVWLWKEEVVREQLPKVYADLLLLAGLNQLCGLTERDLPAAIEKCRQEWLVPRSKLPWRFYGSAQQNPETAGFYHHLDELMQKLSLPYETRARVGSRLKQDYLAVREAVNDQAGVLATWLGQKVGQAPPLTEVRSLLKELPNLALETDDQKIHQEILAQWEKVQHRRLINDLHSKWQEITGSASPQEWSRQRRLPIAWVLTEGLWPQFCEDFARLEMLPDELLAQYGQQLQEHAAELQHRLAQARGQILVQMLLPEYLTVLQDGQRLAQLQEYLVQQVGEAVESWPTQLPRVQATAREWLMRCYQDTFWPEVAAAVATLSPERAKNLLAELVQEPGIGIRLLAKIRQSHA